MASKEIEYRAWVNNCEMVRVDAIIFNPTSLQRERSTIDGPFILDEHNDIHLLSNVILEQYIVKKDKNGVKIYAGDKVKGKMVYQKHRVYTPFEGIVEWSEQYAAFQIRGKDSDGNLCCPMFNEVVFAELEVIGNIYSEVKP